MDLNLPSASTLHTDSVDALLSQVAELDISVLPTEEQDCRSDQPDTTNHLISYLPPEIMSEMFIHCLPTKRSGLDSFNFAEAPFLLSRVCSRWRQIVLSTPELWKELEIDLASRTKQAANIAETWLAHAQHCPLSVKFLGSTLDLVDSTGFSETFRRYASGMQSLELVEMGHDDLKRMAEPIEFPLLRNLSLGLLHPYASPALDDLQVKMFSVTPHLSQLYLDKAPARAFALPWQQLQKFTGEFYELSDCIEALQLMPNLVESSFSVFYAWRIRPNLGMLHHSHMRVFTLFRSVDEDGYSEIDNANRAELLNFVTFPNLETLQLHGIREDFHVGPVPSFLGRGPPPLKRLVVREQGGCTSLMLSMAPLLQPHLTDLEIWYPEKHFTTRFFKSFGHDSGFVPGLEKLYFHCGEPTERRSKEASRDYVLQLAGASLTSRGTLAGIARLRIFRASADSRSGPRSSELYPLPRESVLVPFRRLKQEGVNVYIGTRRSWSEEETWELI